MRLRLIRPTKLYRLKREGKLYEQIEWLKAVTSNLIKTRDMLLSRLISGRLAVEDLDIPFPPSMLNEAETA